MKRSFLLAILVFLAVQSDAQKLSFTDTSNKWSYNYADIGMTQAHYKYYFQDTVVTIDTLNYKLLTANVVWSHLGGGKSNQVILIREDTSAGIVYAKVLNGPENTSADTFEHVLIDYNWKVGDSIKVTTKNGLFVNYVSMVDSVTINSVSHKAFHIQKAYPSHGSHYTIVEGVGCLEGVIYPLYPTQFESSAPLYCYYNNGGNPQVSPAVNSFFDNANSCVLGVKETTKVALQLKVYPQPATNSVTIELPIELKTGVIEIYNAVGQVCINQKISGEKKITINNNSNLQGLNYYRITDHNLNEVYTGKILFR